MTDKKSLQQWENTAFTRIFRFTLEPTGNTNHLYLSQFASELEEANFEKPFLLTSSTLDGALVSRLFFDLPPNTPTVFDYLYDCWVSCNDIKKNMVVKAKNLDPQVVEARVQSLNKTMELLVSYIGLSISYPDMYPNSEYNCPSFAHRLVLESDDSRMIQEAFIVQLYTRFQDDELINILDPLINAINMALMKFTIADDFRTPLRALTILLQHKTIANHFPKLSNWAPEGNLENPLQIESTIALGPAFRLSVLSDMTNPVAFKFFFDNNRELVKDVESTNSSLRLTFSRILDTLFDLVNQIIRSSPQSRDATLKLLADIIGANIKRDGIQVNAAEVSSDRFIVNWNLILLKFCQPFIDRFHNSIHKIDPDYFSKSNLIDLQDAVRINASKEEVEEFVKKATYSNDVNFISHIFHLTYRYFHYGYLTLCSKHRRLQREKNYLEEQIETLEQQGAEASNPNQALMLKRCQMQLKMIQGSIITTDLILMDEGLTESSFLFFNLACSWLVRLVDPTSKHPQTRISLPIQGQPSPQLCMLPEHYLGDISEFFLYQAKNNPKAFTLVSPQDLITFIITFLTHSELIKNPHTKIQLIETLFYSVMNHYNPTESPIGSLLLGDPLALAHLLPALMKFYVDVEHTGLSSQFHDKFNVRYNIALLFKILWNHNEHRLRLSEQAKNMSFFVKFVNLLMNDTTHLLFEALSKLSEIHSIQTEMNNFEQWNAESQEHREQRLETLHTDERQAGSYVALSNENVAMLGYLTLENRRPFLSEEIVDRLAAMLNYTLSGLVGPKCTELKVNNPEKYQFNPKKLLGSLMDIYLNLESERFIKAMANDQRSFKVSYFDRAINILGKFGLKNPSYLDRLRQLVTKVEAKVKDLQMEDEILQDFPSEFEDPLMSTLMRNPVKLPTSGITIDLSTIKSHLLSDNTDPFNRQPLTIDMVVPDHELKAKIEAFIEERLSKK